MKFALEETTLTPEVLKLLLAQSVILGYQSRGSGGRLTCAKGHQCVRMKSHVKPLSSKGDGKKKFTVGEKVKGNYRRRGRWYDARIRNVNDDDSYDLDYDDGERENRVDRNQVRYRDGVETGESAVDYTDDSREGEEAKEYWINYPMPNYRCCSACGVQVKTSHYFCAPFYVIPVH